MFAVFVTCHSRAQAKRANPESSTKEANWLSNLDSGFGLAVAPE